MTRKQFGQLLGKILIQAVLITVVYSMGYWRGFNEASHQPVLIQTVEVTRMAPTPFPTVIPATSTPTLAPTQVAISDGIPTPDTRFYCSDMKDGDVCVNDLYQGPAVQITEVIYLEGGGISLATAVDIIQLIDNRIRSAWICGQKCTSVNWRTINPEGRKFETITPDERKRLTLFLLSEHYRSNGSATYAAWNSWNAIFHMEEILKNPVYSRYYSKILIATENWLATGGKPVISDGSAMYEPLPALVTNKNIIFTFASYGKSVDYLDQRASAVRKFPTVEGEAYIYYMIFPFSY